MSNTHRAGWLATAAIATLFLVPGGPQALNNQPAVVQVPPISLDPFGPVGPVVPELPCDPFIGTAGTPGLRGLTLTGFTVTIDADNVKLWNKDPLCDSYREPIGDRFSWELTERPAASSAALAGTDTLHPTLEIDEAGTYTAVLTVCPDNCLFGGVGPTLPPKELTLRFSSLDHIRPEYHPASPPSVQGASSCDTTAGTCVGSPMTCDNDTECTPFGQPFFDEERLDIICQFGGAVLDPQWVTLQEWNTPQDYVSAYQGEVHAVEGVVTRARISSMDNEFNHHSIDATWNVKLDEIYRHLKLGGGQSMHNEWETDSLHGAFQPSTGDRVSMWGYLIVDCGHGYKTEIHPPVGLAVHRERAIRIPSDYPFEELPDAAGDASTVGTGVYVPGIMTDVWFNRDAGEMTEGDRTGLHQPARHVPGNCSPGQANCIEFDGEFGVIVEGDDIEGLSPIDAVFTFRIHLPRSPKAVLESVGVDDLPELPLYYDMVSGNVARSRITFEEITEPGSAGVPDVTHLLVRVDLRGNIGTLRPWLQIASGWVYPDPSNWGLKARRLIVKKLNVTNEADGAFRGDGDWKLWLQVNNSSVDAPAGFGGRPRQEWTRIIDYDVSDGCTLGLGCGEDETFGGQPWSTGNELGERDLGPDVLVFTGQPVQIHTSGFEGDWFGGDSLGTINTVQYFPEDNLKEPNACTVADSGIPTDIEAASPTNTGCGYFTMFYDVKDLGSVTPVLSTAGEALYDGFSLLREDCGGDDVCVPVPLLLAENPPPPPLPPLVVHPLDAVLEPGEPSGSIFETDLFEPREVEKDVINNLKIEQIHEVLARELETDPGAVEDLLTKMRETFDESRDRLGEEVLLDLQLLELALPGDLFETHFGDLPAAEPLPGSTRRWVKGAGKIGQGEQKTHLNLELYCDPLRRPAKLNVRWGRGHHFELDLMFEVACDRDPDPMRTHAGRGIGRLDGERGYVAAWSLFDQGNPGPDVVRLRIFNPAGEVVREAIGELTGNLHARSPEN